MLIPTNCLAVKPAACRRHLLDQAGASRTRCRPRTRTRPTRSTSRCSLRGQHARAVPPPAGIADQRPLPYRWGWPTRAGARRASATRRWRWASTPRRGRSPTARSRRARPAHLPRRGLARRDASPGLRGGPHLPRPPDGRARAGLQNALVVPPRPRPYLSTLAAAGVDDLAAATPARSPTTSRRCAPATPGPAAVRGVRGRAASAVRGLHRFRGTRGLAAPTCPVRTAAAAGPPAAKACPWTRCRAARTAPGKIRWRARPGAAGVLYGTGAADLEAVGARSTTSTWPTGLRCCTSRAGAPPGAVGGYPGRRWTPTGPRPADAGRGGAGNADVFLKRAAGRCRGSRPGRSCAAPHPGPGCRPPPTAVRPPPLRTVRDPLSRRRRRRRVVQELLGHARSPPRRSTRW